MVDSAAIKHFANHPPVMSFLILKHMSPGYFFLKGDHIHSGIMSGRMATLGMHHQMRLLRVDPSATMCFLPEPRPHELLVVRVEHRAVYMKSWSARRGVTGRVLSFAAALEMMHHIAVCDLLSDPDGLELNH